MKATISPGKQRSLAVLREKFEGSGFEGFADEESIRLFLSLVFPRQGSEKLAARCLHEFKDLGGLLVASPEALEKAGIAAKHVASIRLMRELPAEILRRKIIQQPFYKSSRDIFDYLYYSMRDLRKEVFKVIYLNGRGEIIETVNLFEGTSQTIPIRLREIAESAMRRSPAGVIFVHNHPSGDSTPSKTDCRFTRDVVFVGQIIQIKVVDHLIIGGNDYFSFADDGLINQYELDFMNLKIRMLHDWRAHLGSD